MAGIFTQQSLTYDVTIKARFGSMVCALVARGLGIAIVDEFTIAGANWPDIRALPIIEPTEFETFIGTRKDATLSSYCEYFIGSLRSAMKRCKIESRELWPGVGALRSSEIENNNKFAIC